MHTELHSKQLLHQVSCGHAAQTVMPVTQQHMRIQQQSLQPSGQHHLLVELVKLEHLINYCSLLPTMLAGLLVGTLSSSMANLSSTSATESSHFFPAFSKYRLTNRPEDVTRASNGGARKFKLSWFIIK